MPAVQLLKVKGSLSKRRESSLTVEPGAIQPTPGDSAVTPVVCQAAERACEGSQLGCEKTFFHGRRLKLCLRRLQSSRLLVRSGVFFFFEQILSGSANDLLSRE